MTLASFLLRAASFRQKLLSETDLRESRMTLIAIALAAAAASQPVPAPVVAAGMTDVAYTELTTGNADAAVRKLEGSASAVNDPAVLINLGTAYAQQGATDKALAAFRAAIASRDRYDLELADGSWMDSREAARVALGNLQRATAQAAR
jgi:tetratricopeptide (TPR) repeat protein